MILRFRIKDTEVKLIECKGYWIAEWVEKGELKSITAVVEERV